MSTRRHRFSIITAATLSALLSFTAAADQLSLSSPSFADGGTLPDGLKCTRDGGDGMSPALEWSGVDSAAKSLGVVMEHYPRGTVPGQDQPSHYWLLWNIPTDVTVLSHGNIEGIGNVGSDKDGRTTGYTPPCSPGTSNHTYTIRLFALSEPPTSLGNKDDITIDWQALMTAIDGITLQEASISFIN